MSTVRKEMIDNFRFIVLACRLVLKMNVSHICYCVAFEVVSFVRVR
jgi:hypothetical protein